MSSLDLLQRDQRDLCSYLQIFDQMLIPDMKVETLWSICLLKALPLTVAVSEIRFQQNFEGMQNQIRAMDWPLSLSVQTHAAGFSYFL